jgi:hypothetical protein
MNIFRSVFLVPMLLVLASFAVPAHADDARIRIVSKTHNFGSLVDAAGETVAVVVPGAVLGDACVASIGVDVVDMIVSCSVVSAGSAEIRLQNESGSTADLASTTIRVFLIPKGTR